MYTGHTQSLFLSLCPCIHSLTKRDKLSKIAIWNKNTDCKWIWKQLAYIRLSRVQVILVTMCSPSSWNMCQLFVSPLDIHSAGIYTISRSFVPHSLIILCEMNTSWQTGVYNLSTVSFTNVATYLLAILSFVIEKKIYKHGIYQTTTSTNILISVQ